VAMLRRQCQINHELLDIAKLRKLHQHQHQCKQVDYSDFIKNSSLNDGDIVMINRQPTLNRQSMMNYKIEIVEEKFYSNSMIEGTQLEYWIGKKIEKNRYRIPVYMYPCFRSDENILFDSYDSLLWLKYEDPVEMKIRFYSKVYYCHWLIQKFSVNTNLCNQILKFL
jgi:hypothetical protein